MGQLRSASARITGLAGIALSVLAILPAQSASAAAGWQDWGAWQNQATTGVRGWCRNYVDATDLGSSILISGYFECTRGLGGSVTVDAGSAGRRLKYCFAPEVARRSCYVSFRIADPSGRQTRTVVTISKIAGEPEAARIRFTA